jgi:hypothetical protein
MATTLGFRSKFYAVIPTRCGLNLKNGIAGKKGDSLDDRSHRAFDHDDFTLIHMSGYP